MVAWFYFSICIVCTCRECLSKFCFESTMRTKLSATYYQFPLLYIFVAITLSGEESYISVNINPKHCATPQNAPTMTRYLVLCLLLYKLAVNSNNAILFIRVECAVYIYVCIYVCIRCIANRKCFVVSWIQFHPEHIYRSLNFLLSLNVHT